VLNFNSHTFALISY